MAKEGGGYAAVDAGRQPGAMPYGHAHAQPAAPDRRRQPHMNAMQFSHLRPSFSGPHVYHQFQDASGMPIGRPKEEEGLIVKLTEGRLLSAFSVRKLLPERSYCRQAPWASSGRQQRLAEALPCHESKRPWWHAALPYGRRRGRSACPAADPFTWLSCALPILIVPSRVPSFFGLQDHTMQGMPGAMSMPSLPSPVRPLNSKRT